MLPPCKLRAFQSSVIKTTSCCFLQMTGLHCSRMYTVCVHFTFVSVHCCLLALHAFRDSVVRGGWVEPFGWFVYKMRTQP